MKVAIAGPGWSRDTIKAEELALRNLPGGRKELSGKPEMAL
ncbi:MAG TPA: hypothetical protein VHK01_16115 [Lacipirellulaceae bacterium]|nr:hypothetical protein [Lacipirellulaceae bacterium]